MQLSEAEKELLSMLSEECAEVIQAVAKIQRFGFTSYHPNDDKKVTNYTQLLSELKDVHAVIYGMIVGCVFSHDDFTDADNVWQQKLKYAKHQKPWYDIDTAPRDGSYFLAKSYSEVRTVRYADKYDRYPINDTMTWWISEPTHWRPL